LISVLRKPQHHKESTTHQWEQIRSVTNSTVRCACATSQISTAALAV
jgi:hypothetical protein